MDRVSQQLETGRKGPPGGEQHELQQVEEVEVKWLEKVSVRQEK